MKSEHQEDLYGCPDQNAYGSFQSLGRKDDWVAKLLIPSLECNRRIWTTPRHYSKGKSEDITYK